MNTPSFGVRAATCLIPRTTRCFLLAAATTLAGLSSPLTTPPAAARALPDIELVEVAAGFGSPTSIAAPGDGKIYVSVLEGLVYILAPPGSADSDGVLDQPFLDLSGEVAVHPVKGLLGLAFHPNYPATKQLFVHYIDTAENGVIARFAPSVANPAIVDPASKRVLLTIPHQFAGHNGGQLAFGPDGYLYASVGDDGGVSDPNCNGQNPTRLLGKLLRLDVDANNNAPPYHAIPPDNPFVGISGANPPRPEIWALGLRNPWRFRSIAPLATSTSPTSVKTNAKSSTGSRRRVPAVGTTGGSGSRERFVRTTPAAATSRSSPAARRPTPHRWSKSITLLATARSPAATSTAGVSFPA